MDPKHQYIKTIPNCLSHQIGRVVVYAVVWVGWFGYEFTQKKKLQNLNCTSLLPHIHHKQDQHTWV